MNRTLLRHALWLVAALVSLPLPAAAHEIRPAIVTVSFPADGRYEIEIGVNLEALLAGVRGDLLILLGAMCWVAYTFGAGRFPGWSPLRYSALSCALGVVTIFAATALALALGAAHAPGATALGATWAELLYIVVFASLLAVLGWNAGIKALGALNGVLFINVVPVTAFVIGLALGHRFGGAELLGAALTILALVANNLYLRRRPAAPSLAQAARRVA